MKAVPRRFIVPVVAPLLATTLLLLLTVTPEQAVAQDSLDCGTQWDRPVERENGDPLPLSELGGYEIRVTTPSGDQFERVINDPEVTGLALEACEPGDYQFRVAAFDTDGLYSEFVDLPATAGASSRPQPVHDFRFYEQYPDQPDPCGDRPSCVVMELTSQLLIYSSGDGE